MVKLPSANAHCEAWDVLGKSGTLFVAVCIGGIKGMVKGKMTADVLSKESLQLLGSVLYKVT